MTWQFYLGALVSVSFPAMVWAGPINGYGQTNLVSNIPGLAANTDANLKNPWGISMSSSSPFWVSDNGAGKATLYNSTGTPQGLVVTIPGVGGNPSTPTGQVFNSTASFNGDVFIFATEDGTLTGWRGALGTNAEVLSLGNGGVFKGLANGASAGFQYLYAADFHNNQIVVFPGTGAPALAGNFTDPGIPAGFAPFNIQNIGGLLYVTYAMQDATKHDDVPGAGNGFVSIFGTDGSFVKRLVTQGPLNSPWGVALAPASFGPAGGDLLVGNFGDGLINAFDPTTGVLIGTLADLGGVNLHNDGLWALTFGNGGNGGSPGSLYLTAGLNNEADGLFARIDAVPEPSTRMLIAGGLILLAMTQRRSRG